MTNSRILTANKIAISIDSDRKVTVDPEGIVESIKNVPTVLPKALPGAPTKHVPDERLFGELKINEKFLFNGKTWKKIGPTKGRVYSGAPGRPQEKDFGELDIISQVPVAPYGR